MGWLILAVSRWMDESSLWKHQKHCGLCWKYGVSLSPLTKFWWFPFDYLSVTVSLGSILSLTTPSEVIIGYHVSISGSLRMHAFFQQCFSRYLIVVDEKNVCGEKMWQTTNPSSPKFTKAMCKSVTIHLDNIYTVMWLVILLDSTCRLTSINVC